ncbi:hypothetical protein M9Y10_023956 [Tritrichomonas musculus]|uniref:Uncharacterized protein n=1 Tax=Tritrichomonas musculus TaxID=1915356 RepID=A0ABR2KWI1_9EUKA
MDEESFYFEMANQTADQAFLLLGLDQISTENLINEIKTESNLKIKYSKLLHILIDRLTVMNQGYCNFPEECKDCIKKVKNIFIQNAYRKEKNIKNINCSDGDFVPDKPKDFLQWVPDQFEIFTSAISRFRSKIDDSQRKIDHILTLNTKRERKSQIEKNDDEEKERLRSKITFLKQKIERMKSENEKLLNQIKLKSQVENNYAQLGESKLTKIDKSIECDSELANLKKKYSLISSQVVELQQQIAKNPFKVRLLTEKLKVAEDTNKELQQVNENLKHELKIKTDDLDQERLNNVSREKKFNEAKEKLSNYANDLMKREKEINDPETRNNIIQSLRLQIKTISDHLSSTEKERDLLKKELEQTSAQNIKNNTENDALKAQCSILQNDNINLKKEIQNLMKKINDYEANGIQLSGQMQQNDLKLFSAESQLKDSKTECNNLKEKLKNLQETICKQNKEIVFLETQLTKTKDILHTTTNKLKGSAHYDDLSLQKIGFLLADALNQKYNPKNARSEVERLIEVAHLEHIKLSETGRVKLNPFNCPILNNNDYFKSNSEKPASSNNIYSKFDELDKELSTFSMKQFGDT